MSAAGTALTSQAAPLDRPDAVPPAPAGFAGGDGQICSAAGTYGVASSDHARSISRRSRMTTVSAARSPGRWLRRVTMIDTIVGT